MTTTEFVRDPKVPSVWHAKAPDGRRMIIFKSCGSSGFLACVGDVWLKRRTSRGKSNYFFTEQQAEEACLFFLAAERKAS